MNFKGTLPTLILEALLSEPNHGYRIAQSIKGRSQGVLDFKEGTLYPALHKLESEGMVESFFGTGEDGTGKDDAGKDGIGKGRQRRHYRITNSGRAMLARDRAEWRQLSRAVTTILGEA